MSDIGSGDHGDWVKLIVDKGMVGPKNEHLSDDFTIALSGEAVTIMASLVARLESKRDVFYFHHTKPPPFF